MLSNFTFVKLDPSLSTFFVFPSPKVRTAASMLTSLKFTKSCRKSSWRTQKCGLVLLDNET